MMALPLFKDASFFSSFSYLKLIRLFTIWGNFSFLSPNKLGSCGKNAILETPIYIKYPKGLFMENHSRLRNYCTIINSPDEKVIIKKLSVIATGVTIITDQYACANLPWGGGGGGIQINDKPTDVMINEDVWIGANAMILSGVTIGRGAIVGAGSMVTQDIPPYALAVGSPAKIIAKKFLLEDVIRHEEIIYPPEERLSKEYLTELFETTYKDLKVYGCNTPLTDEQKQLLGKRMRASNFHLKYYEFA